MTVPPLHRHPSYYDDLDSMSGISDSTSLSKTADAPALKGFGAIPDLRFEYSYMRSIRSFVSLRKAPVAPSIPLDEAQDDDFENLEKSGEEGAEATREIVHHEPTTEIIEIQWKKVLWATTRDQILSPLLQGVVWGIVGSYLSPVGSALGTKMGSFVRSKLPSKEGTGVTFLRKLVGGLGLSANPMAKVH